MMRYWKVYIDDGTEWLDAYIVASEVKPNPLFNGGVILDPAVEEITKEEYDAAIGNVKISARKKEEWEYKDRQRGAPRN